MFFQLVTIKVFAQVTVSGGLSATDIINILQGNDIIITNETINCAGTAYGSYDNGGVIGINEGALFTTGTINNALGPNTATGTSGNNGTAGDPLIDNITGVSTFDACILEFDFIPIGNTFVFNYVFGSEEYFEYVCSGFNDGFGFFLSGPNPAGGNYTNQNIATLPNGTPVSINSINNGNPLGTNCVNNEGTTCPCNSTYYIDNTGGTVVEYDGYTTVLDVIQEVVPCETYHIKIVIADGGDGVFDSGIFIKNFSIASINDFTTVLTPAFEGCNNGNVTFEINNPLPYDLNINLNSLNISSANPADYSGVPNSLIIPQGQTNASFSYTAIPDNLEECVEELIIEYTYNLDCGLLTDTMTLVIKDGIEIECSPDVTLACDATLPDPNPSLVNIISSCSEDNITVVHVNDVSNNASGCSGSNKTVTRTYRGTDSCGNTEDCTQVFTFEADTSPPVIIATPPNQTGFVCGSEIPLPYTSVAAFELAGGSLSDKCNTITISSSDVSNNGNECNENIKVITRTYTFTDACNNASSVNQTFTYAADLEAPTIAYCALNIENLLCHTPIPAPYTSVAEWIAGGGYVTDNCSVLSEMTISHTENDGCVNNGQRTIERTYSIADNCNNMVECIQLITYEKLTPGIEGHIIKCNENE